jgi:hypothetical protein
MPDNPARTRGKCMKLALLDWDNAPAAEIQKALGCTHSHLTVLRANPFYQECVKEIEEEWRAKMLKMPGTSALRRKISYALGLATNNLVRILSSPKTSHKDTISAARLIAQMDGRFLGANIDDDGGKSTADKETVAKELVELINRHKATVQ